jgi:hypothetical protein
VNRLFIIDDMRCFAGEAWGDLRLAVIARWCEYNAAYFSGALRPIPIVISSRLSCRCGSDLCSYNRAGGGRSIALNVPNDRSWLVTDNNTLLHEMLHQFLFKRDEDPAHTGMRWHREIARLTMVIGGPDIWAGEYKQLPRNKKPTWLNLPKAKIARWPHGPFGIDLG